MSDAKGGGQGQEIKEDQYNEAKEAQRQRTNSRGSGSFSGTGSSFSSSRSSSDVSDESDSLGSDASVAFSDNDSETDSDKDKNTAPLRVYDARFKIPAQSNLGQLMVAKGKDLTKNKNPSEKQTRVYKKMVKKVEGYKRLVSALAKLFMAVSMIFTMALYSYNIVLINKGDFFVARTR